MPRNLKGNLQNFPLLERHLIPKLPRERGGEVIVGRLGLVLEMVEVVGLLVVVEVVVVVFAVVVMVVVVVVVVVVVLEVLVVVDVTPLL